MLFSPQPSPAGYEAAPGPYAILARFEDGARREKAHHPRVSTILAPPYAHLWGRPPGMAEIAEWGRVAEDPDWSTTITAVSSS
ncbi:unnamed protein product [Heligmosomoides polygyrus]|uniref:DUF1330 domain-containing protein n=1 Tax=Heligmosomoides polygyrus TaxID=6339 RepID=A0A183G8N9_HELPZ|nr:unnamed protein product [Heligmosomoides polygyrus]